MHGNNTRYSRSLRLGRFLADSATQAIQSFKTYVQPRAAHGGHPQSQGGQQELPASADGPCVREIRGIADPSEGRYPWFRKARELRSRGCAYSRVPVFG